MKQSFEYRRTIIVKMGDIIHKETDAIVYPANSHGHMRGELAAAIRLAGDDIVEKAAMKNHPYKLDVLLLLLEGLRRDI